MEPLQEYCFAVCPIDGIDTYIVSPAHYAALTAKQERLEALLPSWARKRVVYFISAAKKFDELYLAFGHHKYRAGLSLEWEPVLCYQKEHKFYHVKYFESWMCRECGSILRAPRIMLMCEADPDFYYETENRFSDIPPFFQKASCPKCGRPLQNHWVLL